MKDIKVIDIDLAKNVFQIHGANKQGKCVLKKRLKRESLLLFTGNIPVCTIGIEACMGAHYWARKFKDQGPEVKIMSPQFVKPYIKSNKNDRNDAAGIAEAVVRPDMKFVPQKTMEQQDMLLIHRARELLIKQRTAQSNQIRGLLAEYGIVIKQGIAALKKLPEILDIHDDQLSVKSKGIFLQMHEQLKAYEKEIEFYEKEIQIMAKQDARCSAVMEIEGIGPITATAVVAMIGDPKAFKNGREVSAWLGLVPRQSSSGNKTRLLGISKRGDSYVRKLLIHGARSVVKYCDKKADRKNVWILDKKKRCGWNKACVALANKNARIIWAILESGEVYNSNHLEKQIAKVA